MRAVYLIVLALLIAAPQANADDLSKPVMLVASPALRGGYSQTVLVAVPRAGVHVGFILNRATNATLAELFPSHSPSQKVVDPVYFGGPVMPEALFAVVNGDPGGDAWPFFGAFFVASSAETVDRVIEQTPNDARYFAGFVGWMTGELEEEIAAGWWYVTDPDPALLTRDPRGAWEGLMEKLDNGRTLPGAGSAKLQRVSGR